MEIEMAPAQLQWSVFGAKTQIYVVLLLLHNPLPAYGMSGWGGCLDGQDVFAAVRENSPPVIVSAELFGELTEESFSWSVRGKDADWFYLDGANLWLNTSAEKVLDRETEGSVLMAELVCYEEDTFQSVYRIVVEILNENDNSPVFADGTEQTVVISELTPVNAVVFKAHATDADNDKIIYSIDQSSPDAEYFKVLLPNSGDVVLAKPLDYETKTLLSVLIHASEMNTEEQYSTYTNISVKVEDGDDQYPHFTPCTVLLEEVNTRVCTNPTYTANVTVGQQQDVVLTFSPGPIRAVDGDCGLGTSLSYVILTGNDEGHFLIDRHTGEMSLTQGVAEKLATAALHLQVMAFQDDDPRKYSVAPVVVHFLALNHFAPQFEKPEYSGFVTVGDGPVALVHTYGSRALVLTVIDQDFNQSISPMIIFSFSPTSNHTELYTITQDGLLIAKTGQLSSRERHIIQVRAMDQESGETTFTTVTVEVLAQGQTAPHTELSSSRLSGCVVGKAVFLSLGVVTLMFCLLYLVVWIKRQHEGHRDPLERGSVAQGKHPNVSLRWFQLVSHGSATPQVEDLPFSGEDCGTSNPVFSYTEKDSPSQCEPSTSHDSDEAIQAANEKVSSQDMENISIETFPCDSPLSAPESLNTPETAPAPTESQNLPSPSPPTSPLPDLLSRRIASAEIDKPFRKVVTPPKRSYSPLLYVKQANTPPQSPEQALVKARLVHLGSSTSDSPHKTQDEPLPETEPATSLDISDHSSAAGALQDGLGKDDEEVFAEDGNESPDLLPDEEELLNVLERCHPVFITFRKF